MSENLLSKILEHTTTPLFVKGDYNTGKTTLLSQKILSLISKNIDEKKIFAVHSNQEGVNKISSIVYEETGKYIETKTTTDFFYFLLHENKEFLDDPKRVVQINEVDMEFFFYDYCKTKGLESYYPKKNLHQISKELTETIVLLQKKGVTLQKIHELEFDNLEQKGQIISAFVAYETYKKENNFIDKFDVVTLIKKILQNKKAYGKILSFCEYLFIDDIEELSKHEIEIIVALFKKNLFVTGNPNRRFSTHFSLHEDVINLFEIIVKPKVYLSNTNFVNEPPLLRNHYRLLEKNSKNNLDKKSNSFSQQTSVDNSFEEITCIDQKNLKEILGYETKNFVLRHPHKTLGIVCRTNEQAREISEHLSLLDVEHERSFLMPLFDNNLIQELLNILKVIEKPREENILLFDILSSFDIKEQTLLNVSRKVQYHEKSYYELFKNSQSICDNEVENTLIKNFFSSLEKCVSLKETKLPLKEFVLRVIFEFGFYYKALQQDNGSINSLNQLVEIISSFSLKHSTSTLKECNAFLEILQKQKSNFLVPNYLKNPSFEDAQIRVTTFDNAKAFCFDEIIVPYCVNKIIPLHHASRKKLFPTKFDLTPDEFDLVEFHLFLEVLSRSSSRVSFYTFKQYDFSNFMSKSSPFLQDIDLHKRNSTDYNNVEIAENYVLKTREDKIISSILHLLKTKKYALAKEEISKLEAIKAPRNSLLGYITPQINDEIKNVQPQKLTYNFSKHFYSVSQLKTYQQCPKKYLFQYIYKIPVPSKHYFDFGTSLHSVLEEIKPEIDKGLEKKKALLRSLKILSDVWISQSYLNANQEKEYYQLATEILKNYIEKEYAIVDNNRETLGLEKKFFLTIDGKKIMGFIDRIDMQDGELIIYDYKTSNSMENKEYLENDLQLYTYALAVKEDKEYKAYPKKMALWYLKHNMISSIEFDEEKALKIRNTLLELIKQVESKNFTAKPTTFSCTYCDFNSICRDAKTRS